jgi:hypothetical protein
MREDATDLKASRSIGSSASQKTTVPVTDGRDLSGGLVALA